MAAISVARTYGYAEVLLSAKKQITQTTSTPKPAAIPYASLMASVLGWRDVTGDKHLRMEVSDRYNDTQPDRRKDKCLGPPSQFFALQPHRICDAREMRL